MTLEALNTAAAVGTFVVITATAIAALVQLRHARANYQISGIMELSKAIETPEYQAAWQFVRFDLAAKLEDPEVRSELANRRARSPENRALMAHITTVGNFYERLGLLVMTGLIDRKVALMYWDGNALGAWEALAPALAIFRRRVPDVWLHFEYFVASARRWRAAHPDGVYPKTVGRIAVEDIWIENDKRYAQSREA
jgi:hypothetical protein